MAVNDLHALLKHELGDLYFAEKHVLKALRNVTKETTDPAIKARLRTHQSETESQIRNLERAFASLGLKVKAEKCPGILGIIEEHDEFKKKEKPPRQILNAFNIGAGLRVEHYEIAAYTSAIATAAALGESECAALLADNLSQEQHMASFLEASGPRAIGAMATAMRGEPGEPSRRSAAGSRRRTASARKTRGQTGAPRKGRKKS